MKVIEEKILKIFEAVEIGVKTIEKISREILKILKFEGFEVIEKVEMAEGGWVFEKILRNEGIETVQKLVEISKTEMKEEAEKKKR